MMLKLYFRLLRKNQIVFLIVWFFNLLVNLFYHGNTLLIALQTGMFQALCAWPLFPFLDRLVKNLNYQEAVSELESEGVEITKFKIPKKLIFGLFVLATLISTLAYAGVPAIPLAIFSAGLLFIVVEAAYSEKDVEEYK